MAFPVYFYLYYYYFCNFCVLGDLFQWIPSTDTLVQTMNNHLVDTPFLWIYSVDSHYLKVQGNVKYFEISVLRHIRYLELRKK